MRRPRAAAVVVAFVLALGGVIDAQRGGFLDSSDRGGPVRGRVEIGVPITAKRPTSAAYPSRAVTAGTLAPISEVRNVIVYLKDAPSRPQG